MRPSLIICSRGNTLAYANCLVSTFGKEKARGVLSDPCHWSRFRPFPSAERTALCKGGEAGTRATRRALARAWRGPPLCEGSAFLLSQAKESGGAGFRLPPANGELELFHSAGGSAQSRAGGAFSGGRKKELRGAAPRAVKGKG